MRRYRPVVTAARLPAAAALLIVLILIGDGVALTRLPRHATLRAPGSLAGEIAQLQVFVEQQRGLEFRKSVDIELVGQDALAERPKLTAGQEKEATDQALVLVALGLADSVDAVRKANDLVAGSTLGRYEPRDRRLLVRRGPIDDFTRSVLAHEMTHALDDQRFGLARPTTPFTDEADLSFHALAEGDATFVEEAYLKAHPQGRRNGQNAEPLPPGIPLKLLAIAAYPYSAGHGFVQSLRGEGGSKAVDHAFRHPPTTSEQILHAARYLRGEQARNVVKPRPDKNDVVDRGVLGELVLRLMFGEPNDPAAIAAAEGWGGDRYVAWRDGSQVCLRAHIGMDTPSDVTELRAALQRWAAAHPGAVIGGTARLVTIDRCVH